MRSWLSGLALCLAASPTLAQDKCPVDGGDLKPSQVVGQIEGKPITLAEVDAQDPGALCKARVEHRQRLDSLRQSALESLIDERLLAAEAKRRQITPDAVLEAAAAAATAPTETDAKALYDQYAAQKVGREIETFEQVKGEIIDALTARARGAAQTAFVAQLRAQAKVRLDLPPLRIPVEAAGFGDGPKDAPITVVVFADYECPYCAKGAEHLEQARAAFPGKVRVVYRDYPLGFHERAVPAAVAARCAGAQKKHAEMHALLYANQQALDDASLKGYAGKIGLDLAAFEKCQADPKQTAAVRADEAAGDAAGVDGTPAFFINGIKLGGAQPAQAFTEIFEAELARGKRR